MWYERNDNSRKKEDYCLVYEGLHRTNRYYYNTIEAAIRDFVRFKPKRLERRGKVLLTRGLPAACPQCSKTLDSG